MRLTAAVLSLFLAAAAPSAAQSASGPEPVFRATHNAWLVFTKGEGRERICYVVSRPTESLPANVQHGEVFFLISTWASGAASEQPSFLAGYPLRPDSPPRARVGSDRFAMYVSENEGFIETERDASRLVGAMRRGATMRVEASSQRGTATVYEFSLSGVTAALNQAAGYCR